MLKKTIATAIARHRKQTEDKTEDGVKDVKEIADKLIDLVFGATMDRTIINADVERSAMLESLCEACKKCRMCNLGWQKAVRGVVECNPQVFSNMKISRYVVVGQNPGWNEIQQGIPFVGAAGANFNKELEENGHTRDEFYITNITKCFTSNNHKPSPECIKKCEPFLRMEFAALKPKIVIALGAVAFNRLCPGMKFSENRGKIAKSDIYDVKVFATYHPSPMNITVPERKKEFKRQIKLLCALIDRLNN